MSFCFYTSFICKAEIKHLEGKAEKMAKLKAKINKGDFAALSESLQELYVLSGEDYILDAEGVEDVTGLKNKVAELLKDTKAKSDMLKSFEGLDAENAKKALEEMAKIEDKKLADRGKYDELLAKQTNDFNTKYAAATEAHNKTLAGLKREKVLNFLTANGVIADRAHYALSDIDSIIDLAEGENGFELKTKDGSELDSVVGNLKTKSGFLFSASGASGTGGSGSSVSGGDSKQMTRAQFDALDHGEQANFSIGGGTLTD